MSSITSNTSKTQNTDTYTTTNGVGVTRRRKNGNDNNNAKKRKRAISNSMSSIKSIKEQIEEKKYFLRIGYKKELLPNLEEKYNVINQQLENKSFTNEEINEMRLLNEKKNSLKEEIDGYKKGIFAKAFNQWLEKFGLEEMANKLADDEDLEFHTIDNSDDNNTSNDSSINKNIDSSKNINKNSKHHFTFVDFESLLPSDDTASEKDENADEYGNQVEKKMEKKRKLNELFSEEDSIISSTILENDDIENKTRTINGDDKTKKLKDDNEDDHDDHVILSASHVYNSLKNIDDFINGDNDNKDNIEKKNNITGIDYFKFDSPLEMFKFVDNDNHEDKMKVKIEVEKNQQLLRKINPHEESIIDFSSTPYSSLSKSMINKQVCDKCKSPYIQEEDAGILICEGCGDAMSFIDTSNNTAQSMYPQKSHSSFNKFISNFDMFLKKFDPTTWIIIESSVFDTIRGKISMDCSGPPREYITSLEIDMILRKEKTFQKYYPHIIQIYSEINGFIVPAMSKEIKNHFKQMFKQLKLPWEKHRGERTKFLSPSFVFKKLCVILDEKIFIPFIDISKFTKSILQQEMIWKKICHELNWDYISDLQF